MKRLSVAISVCLLLAGPVPTAGQESFDPGTTAGEDCPHRAETYRAEADRLRRLYEKETSREAIEKYRVAGREWARCGELREAARASYRIGSIHEQMGALRSSLESYGEALGLSRESGDRVLEAEMLSHVGVVQALLGDEDEALRNCSEALSLAHHLESSRGEAAALICLGEAAYHRGAQKEALEFYRGAEPLWQGVGDRWHQANTSLLLGYSYSDLDEFDRASAHYRAALSRWEALGDRRGVALTLVALGRLEERLGEYQQALNLFNQAMGLVEPMGDVVWQASVLVGVGDVLHLLGESRSALTYWNQALELFSGAGLRDAEVQTLHALGEVHLMLGDHELAFTCSRQALMLSRELGNKRWEAYSLRLLGLGHHLSEEPRKALSFYEEALSLSRQGEDRRFEAYTFGDMARAYEQLGEREKALEHALRAVESSRVAGDQFHEAMGLYGLAWLTKAQGDLHEARQHIEDSLRIVESLRFGVASRELRASYLASIHQYYELHTELLMRLAESYPQADLVAEALRASERSRARSLLESLAEAQVDIRRGAAPELLDSERRLKRTLEGKTERLMRLLSEESDPEEVEALDEEIRELTLRYDQIQAQLRSKSPRYAALTQPQPATLEEIQQQVLDDRTLLLEYALGEERSFLWVVSEREHAGYVLPPKDQIDQATRGVYELLTARQPVAGETLAEHRRRVREADSRYWSAAARLSEVLLGPVADRLAGMRLLIVPDGALQYVPFGALPVPGTNGSPVPMAIEHEIVNLPSASALAVLRRETAGRRSRPLSVAVLADPVFELDDPRLLAAMDSTDASSDVSRSTGAVQPVHRALRQASFLDDGTFSVPRLMATRREADAIVAAAPAGASLKAIGFEASRDTAMSPELGEYRIVHFATHGLVNSENPGLSGIMLSMVDRNGNPQNGFLGLHDIYNLELPVELVVLSACNTALGKEVRGEGLVGIVRGFMYAGAQRVVASLWKVDDEATQELMRRFYHGMLKEQRSPAAALRQAQTEMWRQKPWRPPFFWAAFVLQGEWR